MYITDEIKQKVKKLCELRGYKDDEDVISNCMLIIERYLSLDGSSLEVANYHLQNSLDNGAWLLAWKGIKEETDRLTGDYYLEQAAQWIPDRVHRSGLVRHGQLHRAGRILIWRT